MARYIGFVLLIFVMLLVCFYNSNSIVLYAYDRVDNIEILTDDFNEKLMRFSESELCDFIEGLNIQNYRKFNIEDRVVIEGYTDMFNSYVLINNLKNNIQISIADGVCLVGLPLIKNSF